MQGHAVTMVSLGGAALAVVLLLMLGSPMQRETTAITVSGPDAAGATVALAADARREAFTEAGRQGSSSSDAIRVTTGPGIVRIEHDGHPGADRISRRIADAVVVRRVEADQAIAPPTTTRPATVLQTGDPARSDWLRQRIIDAGHDAAALSTAMTEVTRDLAADQQTAVARPTTAAPDDPARVLLVQLQARRIDLAARYTDSFPGIAITDAEIASVRALLRHEAPTVPAQQPAAAMATLKAEQERLSLAMGKLVAEQDLLQAELASLDAARARYPAATAPPVAGPASTPATYGIVDDGITYAPDLRPAGAGAIGATILVAAALDTRRRRRQLAPPRSRAGRIAAIERGLRLPVLRCLDAGGEALLADGSRLRRIGPSALWRERRPGDGPLEQAGVHAMRPALLTAEPVSDAL